MSDKSKTKRLKLDLIVANSNSLIDEEDAGFYLIEASGREVNFDYSAIIYSEHELLNETDIPQKAIVLTHGGGMKKHAYLGYVKQLSEQRPDLRFVVALEFYSARMSDEDILNYFSSKELFDFYQSIVDNEFDPENQVSPTFYGFDLLFSSAFPCHKKLQDYIFKYMEMRKQTRE